MEELNIDPKRYPPESISRQISDAKNQLLGPAQFREQGGRFAQIAADVYELYEKRHAEMNAMDFDDLLMKTVELLEGYPDRLEHYQQAFRFVLVDEYQDTNHAQYRLANLLAGAHGNLAVVGDDDQSIYSWRGADIRNILEFERDHPDAEVIRLEQNYRSTQKILDAANAVVTNNRKRKGKNLWTPRGEGALVQVVEVNDERAEAQFVASEVQKLLEGEAKGAERAYRPDEVAVLYRTNAQSRVLEEQFGRYAIAYQVIGGPKFYERAEIRDLIAYLTILVNPDDTQRLLRIVNTPKRGIGATSLQRLQAHAASVGESLWTALREADDVPGLSAGAVNGLLAFARIMEGLQATQAGRPVAEVVRSVIDESGYEAALAAQKTLESEGRLENIEEFVERGRRVRQARRRAQPGRLPPGDLAVQRQRRPRRHQFPAHAHDAAQRQGSRVPGGLHRRDGGGRVPAPALAGRTERGGGAAARLRGHHARHGQAVPRARAREDALGRVAVQHAVTLPRRDPDRAHGAADHRRPFDQLGVGRRPRQLGRRLVGSRRQRRWLERPRRAPRR